MSVSKEAIEAFGQSFWLVNARSKIDANYHEIEAALTAALPHLGSGEAVPVAWRCAECGCLTFARVDERGADGHFHPGSNVRCVNCKRVSYWPDPAPPSSGLMEEVKALRQIISECAEACGAGIAPTASIEFMAKLPDEIRLSAKLKDATP